MITEKPHRSRAWPASSVAPLPADLLKLRERYLAEFPGDAIRVDRLAQVPAAFRHLLMLQLDLKRADALPARYRDLAMRTGTVAADPDGDVVDQLVVAFAAAFGSDDAGRLLVQLQRYFTESQLIELTLVTTLARAFAGFDALQMLLRQD